jgi:hypothetical protein
VPAAVKPKLEPSAVSAVVAQHRVEVLRCFAEGKKADRNLQGTLTLQLAVDAAGKVQHVAIKSTLSIPVVSNCVSRAATAWKFPNRPGGDVANVAYPFTIN